MADKGFPIQSFTALLDSAYDGSVMTGMQWRLGPDGQAFAYPGSGGGGGGTVPTGTGFVHITSGAQDGAAKLVQNADVANAAAIVESKLALNYATHSNINDPTAAQKAALEGSSGTPGASNVYVTNADPRLSDARTPTTHTHPLSQIQQSSASSGDVAKWNGSAWVPSSTATPASHTHPLSQLTQSAASSGDVAKWNGSAWVPSATATPASHTHPLSDLTQSGASSGDVATWNGSAWVPQTPSGSSSPAAVGAKCKASSTYNLIAGSPGGKSIFTTEVFDTDGFFSAGSPGEFTVPAGMAGYYLLQAEGLVDTVSYYDGERTMFIRDKATPTTIYAIARYSHSTNEIGFNISGVAYLADGATIEVVFSQGTASALVVETGYFSLMRLGT